MKKIGIICILNLFSFSLFAEEKTITEYDSNSIVLRFMEDFQVKYWLDDDIYFQNGEVLIGEHLVPHADICSIDTDNFGSMHPAFTKIYKNKAFVGESYYVTNSKDLKYRFDLILSDPYVNMFSCDFKMTGNLLTIENINKVLGSTVQIEVLK